MDKPKLKNKCIWNYDFETGIKRIDFEHQVFLELINSFRIAVEDGQKKSELESIILELEKYAEFHFVSEENFMRRINYPGYIDHQSKHLDLLEEFNIAKHDETDYLKFIEFVYCWFVHHTIGEDGLIKNFVDENHIDFEKFHYNILP